MSLQMWPRTHSNASPDMKTFKQGSSINRLLKHQRAFPATFHISPSHTLMLLKCADGGLPAAGLVCEKTSSPDVSPDVPRCHFLPSGAGRRPGVSLTLQPSVNQQMNEVKEGKWMFKTLVLAAWACYSSFFLFTSCLCG